MLDLDYSENIYDEPFDDPLYEGDEGQLALGAAAGLWLGGLGGGELSGYLYDTAAGVLAGSENKRASDFGRKMKKSRWGRTLVTNTGSKIGGAAGGALGAAIPWFEAEAGEEAYEARDVDEMAALLEVALKSDGEGAEDALSSLVNKAFGVLHGTNRLHDAMRAVHAKVRQIRGPGPPKPSYAGRCAGGSDCPEKNRIRHFETDCSRAACKWGNCTAYFCRSDCSNFGQSPCATRCSDA